MRSSMNSLVRSKGWQRAGDPGFANQTASADIQHLGVVNKSIHEFSLGSEWSGNDCRLKVCKLHVVVPVKVNDFIDQNRGCPPAPMTSGTLFIVAATANLLHFKYVLHKLHYTYPEYIYAKPIPRSWYARVSIFVKWSNEESRLTFSIFFLAMGWNASFLLLYTITARSGSTL